MDLKQISRIFFPIFSNSYILFPVNFTWKSSSCSKSNAISFLGFSLYIMPYKCTMLVWKGLPIFRNYVTLKSIRRTKRSSMGPICNIYLLMWLKKKVITFNCLHKLICSIVKKKKKNPVFMCIRASIVINSLEWIIKRNGNFQIVNWWKITFYFFFYLGYWK